MSTYQTRIAVYEGRDRAEGDAALSASAELYGRVQRKLFADVVAGRSAASLKSDYIKKHGIPARMFNGVRVSLEGKVASVRESQRLQQDSLQRRIARAQRQVSDAAEHGRWDQVHQKKRRLANLRHRLVGLEADIAEGWQLLPTPLWPLHGRKGGISRLKQVLLRRSDADIRSRQDRRCRHSSSVYSSVVKGVDVQRKGPD